MNFKTSYKTVLILFLTVFFLLISFYFTCTEFNGYNVVKANSCINKMPFYNLSPEKLVLRAEFYTSYTTSSPERKHNIFLASSKLNNTLIDVNAEFSFNDTVGERSEKNGFKKAKIIFNNQFIDGFGGGVCQVSTTLYNAVLLSNLKITEYHAHSLPVSYIAPSFDAMVNSGSADLKFVNNTSNPIIICTTADESQIKVSVYGEKMREKLVRQSIVTGEIPAPPENVIIDKANAYPELFEGERKVISYSKKGFTSEGVLIKYVNGKIVSSTLIRKDKYNASKGVIIVGTAKPPAKQIEENNSEDLVYNTG